MVRNKVRINETLCRRMQHPEKGVVRYWDDQISGFGLFVGKKTQTFYFQHEVNGATQRVLLGHWPGDNAADARTAATELARDKRRGMAKQFAVKVPTLQKALDAYLAREKLRSEKNKEIVRGLIENHVGDWLDLPLNEITRAMVVARHQKMRKRPAAANHTMRSLRTIWRNANRTATLPEAPTVAIEFFEERPDGRIIDDLPAFKKAVEAIENRLHQAAYMLALHTGFRKTEVCSLTWANVHDDHLHLPMTKNGRAFDFPITDVHRDILNPLRGLDDVWVFPAAKSTTGYLIKPTPIDYTFHMCRRTFATVGVEAGILEEIVARLLNHTPTSVTGSRYVKLPLEALRTPMLTIVAEIERRLKKNVGNPLKD